MSVCRHFEIIKLLVQTGAHKTSTSKAYIASEMRRYGDVWGWGGEGRERGGAGSPLTEYGYTVHTVLALLARLLIIVCGVVALFLLSSLELLLSMMWSH